VLQIHGAYFILSLVIFRINLPGYFLFKLDGVGSLNSLMIDTNGWLQEVSRVPSPNYEARPQDCDIDLIVVHGISLPPGQYGGGYVHDLFNNRLDPRSHEYFREIEGLKVSAHCLIERDGALTQFVSFRDRAWHAGASCWRERENCNDFSVGIELEGSDDEPYELIQYEQLARVVIALRNQYPALSEQAICGHSDIAPGRKTDPGPFFDWQLLQQKLREQVNG
jgi:AmpD protein